MELLGSGYPFEIHIVDHESNGLKKIFVPEETGIDIQNDMNKKDLRYITIGGAMYFWSDVKYCARINIAPWLDKLVFKSGLINNPKYRIAVLKELTRRMKVNTGFHGEDDVFLFLTQFKEHDTKER